MPARGSKSPLQPQASQQTEDGSWASSASAARSQARGSCAGCCRGGDSENRTQTLITLMIYDFFFFIYKAVGSEPHHSSHTHTDTLLAPAAHGTDAQKQKAIFPLSQSSDKNRRIQVPGFIFTICLKRQELCPGTETARAGSADFLGLTAPSTSLHHSHYSASPTFERGEITSTKHYL